MGDVTEKRLNSLDRIALRMARMWGTMETLGVIPSTDAEEMCDLVTAWAEEFAAGGFADIVDFFGNKIPQDNRALHEEEPPDGLWGNIYDKVACWEEDGKKSDMAYDVCVESLLERLAGHYVGADVERVSETIYAAAYEAKKAGFLLGGKFLLRLLVELNGNSVLGVST